MLSACWPSSEVNVKSLGRYLPQVISGIGLLWTCLGHGINYPLAHTIHLAVLPNLLSS